MTIVHFDSDATPDDRRRAIYAGDVFVSSAGPASLGFIAHARTMIEDAFGDLDPQTAQHDLAVEDFVSILADLKPAFIHHPDSKRHLQAMLEERGCDPEQTYFDVPRMRTACAGDYLTSGIAYAFHPHRDTWYSAPMTQINWWLPIWPVRHDNIMAFHPQYFNEGLRNGSHTYNYAQWVATSRSNAASHVGEDTREQPRAEDAVPEVPNVRVVLPAGATMMFSAAQLHSTVPNTSDVTRFSIDFRTIHLGDSRADGGARNVDSNCTGTTMGDYLRATDLAHVPRDVIDHYEPGHPDRPALVTS